MSNICRRIAKARKVVARKRRQAMHKRCEAMHERCEKKYTSFNIFTKGGENIVVETERPMTIVEAQYIYGALAISGNE